MLDSVSIRWHSRAGQGAVTAAGFLAEAMALLGYQVQSFPDFGAEKRGAPVVVFNRVSRIVEVLDDPAHLMRVDLVVLMDPTLVGAELSYGDILEGVSKEGILFINTAKTQSSGFHERFEGAVFHLDATQIAFDTIGRNIPNVAMMGVLASILKLDYERMASFLRAHLAGSFPEAIVEKNLIGFERGYEKVFKPIGKIDKVLKVLPSPVSENRHGWQSLERGGGMVSDMGSSVSYDTGNWVPKKLCFEKNNCIDCGLCWPVCPDDAIIFDDEGHMMGVDLNHCKDCGLCVKACPMNQGPDKNKHALFFQEDYKENF